MVSAWRAANWRPRGEPPAWAITGRPCTHGPELSGPRERVPAPLEVDLAHLGVVHQHAALRVGHERAGLPRIPELAHQVHVFVGHVVAQIVLRQAVQAEIARGEVGAAGDHVPAGAPVRHLVQRRHQPGQEIGRVGEGREGGDDADPAGHGGHQAGDDRRVLPRHCDRVVEVDLARGGVAFAYVGRVLEQDVVEAGALERLGDVGEQLGLPPGLADAAGPGFAPGLHAGALQEQAEMERLGHRQ